MKRNLVALFDHYSQAEKAVDRLAEFGVDRNAISIVAAPRDEHTEPPDTSGGRAGAGAALGTATGAAIGLTALALPIGGPILALGPIAGAFSGALLGALFGLGIDRDASQYYAKAVEKGGAVVGVSVEAEQWGAVQSILRASEGVQIHLDPTPPAPVEKPPADEPDAVPVAATESEKLSTPQAPHPETTASVSIDDRAGVATPHAASSERPDAKPMYPAESVTPPGTGDHQSATGAAPDPEDADDTRVKTDSGPEHWAPRNEQYSSSFDEFAGVMAREHSVMLAGRGADYDLNREAYDFGYRMAAENRLAERDWSNVEDQLSRDWQSRRTEPWDQVRSSVQQGWEANRGMG